MATLRISDEPAYVLHRHDWSETSLILDVFTRHHGRTALAAKGAKRPHSSLRPVLLPLQPLRLSFGGEAEVRTLKSAEWVGGHVMPTGEALLSGCYLNELLLRLLARDDPHPALFDAYAAAVRVLATPLAPEWPVEVQHAALRAFELLLLREVGFLPALDQQTLTLAPLQTLARYCLVPEGGLRLAHDDDRASLPGHQWLALQAALDQPAPYTAVLRACSSAPELRSQLRQLLTHHCGVRTLRTRQMMIDLQNL